MVDWTKGRKRHEPAIRTVQHYGGPGCPHIVARQVSRLIDGMMVVTCLNCGQEVRYALPKRVGFPRQRPA